MTRREAALYVGCPATGILISAAVLPLLPPDWLFWFLCETGPVEIATATLFFAAGVVGLRHVWKYRRSLPTGIQVLFGLFIATTVFVALEELSYGQHLLHFSSPQWFEEHNKQSEFNVHNLYGNRPSHYIRLAGSFAVPIFCVALPLYYRRRPGSWEPGHWTHFLLPKTELMAIAVLAQIVTLPTKLPSEMVGRIPRLGELKELYWAAGALCYILLVSHRYEHSTHNTYSSQNSQASTDAPLRRAA